MSPRYPSYWPRTQWAGSAARMARNIAVSRVVQHVGVAGRRRIHGGRGDDLHQVVDDDVAQRADGVVEVTAVLDPEFSAIVICTWSM